MEQTRHTLKANVARLLLSCCVMSVACGSTPAIAAEAGEAELLARLGLAGEDVSCGADFKEFKPDIPEGMLGVRRFVAVALRSSLPERLRTMAVADDGTVALLPDDFDKLVTADFKRGFDAPKALALAKAWLVTNVPPPGAFEVIANPAAPQYNQPKRGWKAVDVAKLVAPPGVEAAPEGFAVTLASWRRVGGAVDIWTFSISARAGVVKVSKHNVADAAGQFQVAN